MSRKRSYTGELPPCKQRRTEHEQDHEQELQTIIVMMQQLMSTVGSLETTIREQRYAIERLQHEMSNLQSHALHGAFNHNENVPEGYGMY